MSGLQNLILGYGRPRNDYVEIRRESPVPVTSKGAQGHAHTPRISNVYHPVRVPTTIKTLNLPYNPEVRNGSLPAQLMNQGLSRWNSKQWLLLWLLTEPLRASSSGCESCAERPEREAEGAKG